MAVINVEKYPFVTIQCAVINVEKYPFVTIQCAVYNHAPYLRQCLDGFIMQQTNFPFEAVVHDDASTDTSADIIREYADKYPDIIKPIYEKENQYSKHDGSLQKIIDQATQGKYIAVCEGDEIRISCRSRWIIWRIIRNMPCASLGQKYLPK